AADNSRVVANTLAYLRVEIAKEQNMIDESKFAFLWIVNWPLFDWDVDLKRYVAAHHPFTMPNENDVHYLMNEGEDPHKAYAQSYDIILNGLELGGGS
ncbi:aspartate--tRNA ligase, partial [Lactobacillus parabuchneri]|nr:aspartate--tRNA ligase [Lentilactobacillus parabuchneri]